MENELKERIFLFAQFNFLFNLLYCSINILRFIKFRIYFGSIYCPNFIVKTYIQFIDLVIFKYLCASIKFCCALTEFYISLSRYCKVTDTKSKIFKIFNDTSLSKHIIIISTISMIINIFNFF